MKKLLFSCLFIVLFLSGCGSDNSDTSEETESTGSESIQVEGEKEKLTGQLVIDRSIEKYGNVHSYVLKTNIDMLEDDKAFTMKTITTIDGSENAKFEADIDGNVSTYYEVDDKAFTVENGELKETDALNISSNASYGDIIKITKDLKGGKIKQEDDQFTLTFDLANEENQEAYFGSNLAQSVGEFEELEGTLVLTYSKEYLLTNAKVEGTAKSGEQTIGFEATSNFQNVDSVETIELPE